MKRPEDRAKPGRKSKYTNAQSLSMHLPSEIVDRVDKLSLPGVTSRNAKLIALLEAALDATGKATAVA